MYLESVLVVCGDRNARLSAVRFLTFSGFRVFQASDAPEALRWLDSIHMDAVLVDGDHLADDGLTALLASLARIGGSRLVYLTSRERALVNPEVGASFLHKPCQPARLLGAVGALHAV